MKAVIKLYLVILGVFLFKDSLLGQNSDSTQVGTVVDAQIVIKKDRSIELTREDKIDKFIHWVPDIAPLDMPEQEVRNFNYSIKADPITLNRPELELQENEPGYRQYVKLGYGNYGSPLAEVRLVTPGDPNLMAGVNFSHLSFTNGVVDGDNSASSASDFRLYGHMAKEKVTLKPYLDFSSTNNRFYGYMDGANVSPDDIERRNQYLGLGIELLDNQKDQIDYQVDARWRSFNDNYDSRENLLSLNALISFKDKFYLRSSAHVSKVETTESHNRSAFRLTPYYRITLGELTLDAGLTWSGHEDQGNMPGAMISPYLDANYSFDEKTIFYAKVDGGIDYLSLDELSQRQSYLNPISTPVNSRRIYDIKIGATHKITNDVLLGADVNSSSTDQMLLFINNNTDQALLDAVYDPGLVTRVGLKAYGTYFLNDDKFVKASWTINQYSSGDMDEVYHVPTMAISLSGAHQWFEKVYFNWQYQMLSGIKTMDVATGNDVKLDAISRLDVEVNYQIHKQIGVFVGVDNLFSQQYARFLNYPQRGLMFKAGLTARF